VATVSGLRCRVRLCSGPYPRLRVGESAPPWPPASAGWDHQGYLGPPYAWHGKGWSVQGSWSLEPSASQLYRHGSGRRSLRSFVNSVQIYTPLQRSGSDPLSRPFFTGATFRQEATCTDKMWGARDTRNASLAAVGVSWDHLLSVEDWRRGYRVRVAVPCASMFRPLPALAGWGVSPSLTPGPRRLGSPSLPEPSLCVARLGLIRPGILEACAKCFTALPSRIWPTLTPILCKLSSNLHPPTAQRFRPSLETVFSLEQHLDRNHLHR